MTISDFMFINLKSEDDDMSLFEFTVCMDINSCIRSYRLQFINN